MPEDLLPEEKAPQQIGRYQVKFSLGQGGMAKVYACYDPHFDRDVAVKVLPHELLHNPMFRTRFEREAKTIAALEHPVIVPVHDFGEENGQPYLVMRLMPGGALADRLENGPLETEEIVRIFQRIGAALDKAHQLGVIHRDLKPGNILFDQDQQAFLSDFGIARMPETYTSLTGTGTVGTPGYMSPEQIQGKPVDGRSDVYALGVLLFEALTGQNPFHADTPAMAIVKQMTEPVPNICELLPHLPPAYDDLIRRLTSQERENRPATASEIAQLLAAINKKGGKNGSRIFPVAPTPSPTPFPAQVAPPLVQPAKTPPQTPAAKTPTPPKRPPAPAVVKPDKKEPGKAPIICPHCRARVLTNGRKEQLKCRRCGQIIHLAGHLCPYCETYHDVEAGFCEKCGAALTRICVHCDTSNWAGNERCRQCGVSLDIFEQLRSYDRQVSAQKREERLRQLRYRQQERPSTGQEAAQLSRSEPQTRWPLAWLGIALLTAVLIMAVILLLLFIF